MDMSEHERQRLTEIEKSLIVDAPGLQRAFRGWSTRPLRAVRARTTLRAAAARPAAGVVLSVIVLAVGLGLLVLGVVHGWLAVTLAGVVTTQFGPWLVARSARARTARVPSRPLAVR